MSKAILEQPAITPVSPGQIPDAEVLHLNNGIPVFLIKSGTEEIVRIEFIFNAGQARESIPLVASMTNMMLTEGSAKYSATRLNNLLDFHGVFFSLFSDKDRAGITMFCMNKYLEKILELSQEILFHPLFPEKDLKALLRKRQRRFLVNREKVQNIALDHFFESIFGGHHPYGRMIVEEDFERIDPSLLKEFHLKYYNPGKMAVIISGRLPSGINELLNKHFGFLPSVEKDTEEIIISPECSKNRQLHIEKKGALQTAIRIGSPEINKRHPDYPGLKVLNTILGGYFGSRLMKNIREDKGYTYGIHSSVSSLNLSGYKIISAEVNKKNSRKAIDEIYREITLLQSVPVETGEMEIVRNYMLGDMLRMFDGPFALAESFRSAWEFGLDNSYYYRLAGKIKTIDQDEITSLARTYYNLDHIFEITAG